jgi:hypothetical protein
MYLMVESDNVPTKTKTLLFTADALLVRSPIKFLQDEIAQNRLLEGLIVSVMSFA